MIFSDRVALTQATNDQFALANVIHELISGMRLNKLLSGKLMFHAKVKNSPYFRHIETLVRKSLAPVTVQAAIKDRQKAQEQRSLQKKNNPPLRSNSCPQMHTKFLQFKADADLFVNGTVLNMRPYAVKYGPFQQIVKIIAPNWSCCGNPKAIWDFILRLDYGPSPFNGRFELKSNFLGKVMRS